MSNGIGGVGQKHIEILSDTAGRWRPVVGNETTELLEAVGLPQSSRGEVLREALEILCRCVNPSIQEDPNTGLVVGYVQSGKTLSFTTVAALAHDNGYRMVIVITGMSKPLTDQSHDRLRRDLRLGLGGVFRPWQHFHNPGVQSGAPDRINDVLSDWDDPTVPKEERRTVLLTLMKNHRRLNNLIDALQRLRLEGVPTLIIDDEADQAGLNNLIREGQESTTYRRLRSLRQQLPRHTFLQYTATPQGPLLINIIDVLSPDFAAVLTPGAEYVGGQQFFTGNAPLVRVIPPLDIPTVARPMHEPPDSLLEAMRIFFLGVASGLVRRDYQHGRRSMMVHPSMRTIGHEQYFAWVQQVRGAWMQILEATVGRPDDPDRCDLLDSFRNAFTDLQRTVQDLEAFEVLSDRLLHALRRTQLVLVNSLPQAVREIVWGDSYSWIVVGGQALDRGFTVEGLTVTYMPRGVGVGNADTIQQRARFFGYKGRYLGYCRVFLEPALSEAFSRYVTHEEDVRMRLVYHSSRGLALTELRRAFFLDQSLRPTRASILDIDYVRPPTAGWTYPRVPHEPSGAVEENKTLVRDFLGGLTLTPNVGDAQRTDIQRHFVATGISLRRVFEDFLTRLRVPSLTDNQVFTAALIILDAYLLHQPNATCTVFQISQGGLRDRGVNDDGEIINLFQGEAPVNPVERRGDVYPGDRAIRGTDGVTLQVHMLNIRENASRGSSVIASNVPVVALWIDPQISDDVIVQDQGARVVGR